MLLPQPGSPGQSRARDANQGRGYTSSPAWHPRVWPDQGGQSLKRGSIFPGLAPQGMACPLENRYEGGVTASLGVSSTWEISLERGGATLLACHHKTWSVLRKPTMEWGEHTFYGLTPQVVACPRDPSHGRGGFNFHGLTLKCMTCPGETICRRM